MNYGYYKQIGRPFSGAGLEELKTFLKWMDLSYDEGITFTTVVRNEQDQIVATASLHQNIIKCVAVDPSFQGNNITAALLTEITQEAMNRGHRNLFLYTKPQNEKQFASLGFHKIAATGDVLLMENRRNGFLSWAQGICRRDAQGVIGSLVMNCNPMTLGHRYLIEQAKKQCDFLYIFIVTENRSAVPTDRRREIVKKTVGDLQNVAVVETEQYLISSVTFPDYFLKEKHDAARVWCELDIAVFSRLAEQLQITRRFVGTEPFCPVTRSYNQAMSRLLPAAGVEFIEISRLEKDGRAISATDVRNLIVAGHWQEIKSLVPEETFAYFSQEENRRLFVSRMQEAGQSEEILSI